MQRRLAEELRALRLDNRATLLSPRGAGYSTSIQRIFGVSVAATGASLVFPSCGSSSSSSTSLSSTGSVVVTPSSGAESYKLLRMEAFRELSEIASHMVNDGYTEGLITEFSQSGGDAILQTWFSELGVDWVLGVDESSLHGETWSAVEDKIKQWAVAFTVMVEALRLTRPALCSDDGSGSGLSTDDKNSVVSRSAPPAAQKSSSMLVPAATSPGSSLESSDDQARHRSVDVATVKEAIIAYSVAETGRFLGFGGGQEGSDEPQNQFVIFAEASLTKMLRFPRVVAALQRSPEKILRMIDMYSLVSDASSGLLALLTGRSKGLVSCTIESVLQTLSVAVWEILQNLKKLIGAEDSWRATMQASNGDIHPVNQYMVNYINLLLENCTVLDSMLRQQPVEVDDELTSDEAFFVMELSKDDNVASLTAIVVELISLLDAMLEEKSKVHAAAAAAGRGYIFLLDNAYFTLQQAEPALRKFLGTVSVVYRKQQIDRYIGRYLDASWGPVTAFLAATGKQRRNSVFRKVSALVDFNASLQMTYHREKFWKINSPQLRSRLRKSVSNKVVSAYRAYLEKHALVETSATYIPEDLEDLFEDLFEG